MICQFENSNEPRGLAGIHETTQHKILLERRRTSVGNSDSRINPNRQGATRSSIKSGTQGGNIETTVTQARRYGRPVWDPAPCAAAPSLGCREEKRIKESLTRPISASRQTLSDSGRTQTVRPPLTKKYPNDLNPHLHDTRLHSHRFVGTCRTFREPVRFMGLRSRRSSGR